MQENIRYVRAIMKYIFKIIWMPICVLLICVNMSISTMIMLEIGFSTIYSWMVVIMGVASIGDWYFNRGK